LHAAKSSELSFDRFEDAEESDELDGNRFMRLSRAASAKLSALVVSIPTKNALEVDV